MPIASNEVLAQANLLGRDGRLSRSRPLGGHGLRRHRRTPPLLMRQTDRALMRRERPTAVACDRACLTHLRMQSGAEPYLALVVTVVA